jgi:hypothetical protein
MAKKILDAETLEYVDAPEESTAVEEKKSDEKPDDKSEEEKSEEEKPEESETEKKSDVGEVTTEIEDEFNKLSDIAEKDLTEEQRTRLAELSEKYQFEDEEEKKPDKKEDKKPDKKEDKKPDVSVETLNAYIKANSNKLGFESLEAFQAVVKENSTIKSQLEELKKGEPKFNSKSEKAAFEFLKAFDVDQMADGIATYGRILAMDPEKIGAKDAILEKFIIDNKELPRAKAEKLFESWYNETFVADKEAFEDDEEGYKRKQELLDIKKEREEKTARNFLLAKKEELKIESKKPASEGPKPVDQKVVKKYLDIHRESMDGFDAMEWVDDEKNPQFTFKMTPEQIKSIDSSIQGWINMPDNYKDGELSVDYDPEDIKQRTAFALFGPEIVAQALQSGIEIGQGKKVEEIAEKGGSNRKTRKVALKREEISTFEDSAEQLAKQKKAAREAQPQTA